MRAVYPSRAGILSQKFSKMDECSFRDKERNLSVADWGREGKAKALVVCLSGTW